VGTYRYKEREEPTCARTQQKYTGYRRIQIWTKAGFRSNSGSTLKPISKPIPYPKSEKPPARKGFTKPNL